MNGAARLIVTMVAAAGALAAGATAADGATPGAVYSYSLDGSTSLVANQGAATGVDLQLLGAWSPSANGVRFDGDRVQFQSGAAGRPASGPTLRVASATQGVGAAIDFTYDAPERGCFPDTVNLTQIGRFGRNQTQVKLQLSDCGDGGGTTVQCRMAGNVSSGVTPKGNSLVLVDGARYVAQCLKGPDPRSGSATMNIRVTRVDTGQVVETHHSIARTGTMTSYEYLSVANKYPFPAQSRNTDQFVGEVAKVAYCVAASFDAVRGCLDTEMTPPPVTTAAPRATARLRAG